VAERAEDWFRQAGHDLEHARKALVGGDFEWACFAAHQAAEKALKALFQKAGEEARGHSVLDLLAGLREVSPQPAVQAAARALDRHYIPARYPNAYPKGAPHEFYTEADASRAIADSEQILRFCQDLLA